MVLYICLTSELVEAQEHSDTKQREKPTYLKERIWMGMEGIFFDSSSLSLLLQHDLPGGVLLQHVLKGSPADKAGLRGGIIPARINGQDILLGGDLILELGNQQACHSECLVEAHRHLQGMNQIRVMYLRGGKIMETTVDVSASRRKFID
jgi:S1-C subfamily serine protease